MPMPTWLIVLLTIVLILLVLTLTGHSVVIN